MLAKAHRLVTSDHKLKSSVVANCANFTVRKIVAESNVLQAAVVVSSKVSKKSVIRNQIKRRIYTAIRELMNSKDLDQVLPTAKYILIVKKDAKGKSVFDFKSDILNLNKNSE